MKIVKNQDSEKSDAVQKISTVPEQCYLDEKLPAFKNASIIMPKHLELFPSLEEIHYCLRKKLFSRKDLIVFKLIIDMHQAIFDSKKLESRLSDSDLEFAIETLIPCQLKFYKILSQNELTLILKRL
jgi:hypothetical protein